VQESLSASSAGVNVDPPFFSPLKIRLPFPSFWCPLPAKYNFLHHIGPAGRRRLRLLRASPAPSLKHKSPLQLRPTPVPPIENHEPFPFLDRKAGKISGSRLCLARPFFLECIPSCNGRKITEMKEESMVFFSCTFSLRLTQVCPTQQGDSSLLAAFTGAGAILIRRKGRKAAPRLLLSS